MYNKIREIQRTACFVLSDCQWPLGKGTEAGADGSVQLSPHSPPSFPDLCRLEHGDCVRISPSELSSAVRAVVLGVACQASIREPGKSCRLHPLLSLTPVGTHREMFHLGKAHGGAGGCLCLWELMRLIPVFHAVNYSGERRRCGTMRCCDGQNGDCWFCHHCNYRDHPSALCIGETEAEIKSSRCCR